MMEKHHEDAHCITPGCTSGLQHCAIARSCSIYRTASYPIRGKKGTKADLSSQRNTSRTIPRPIRHLLHLQKMLLRRRIMRIKLCLIAIVGTFATAGCIVVPGQYYQPGTVYGAPPIIFQGGAYHGRPYYHGGYYRHRW
jgi:hypothetical protein